MRYKREQLPFAEFADAAKELKNRADNIGPHYPLIAIARDVNGQEIMWQRFEGPYKRPEPEISKDVAEWDCPVTVTIESECAASIPPEPKVFETVTVPELSDDATQASFFPADYVSTWDEDQRKQREQRKKEIEDDYKRRGLGRKPK